MGRTVLEGLMVSDVTFTAEEDSAEPYFIFF